MTIDELKQQIKDTIKTNNNGEITGQVLQNQLLAMIDTISESDKEIFVCDFINEKTSSITDAQYNELLNAVNARNIVLIGSTARYRIIDLVELSSDVLTLGTEYTIDVDQSLIITTIQYDVAIVSENSVHAVNVKSSSQSLVYNGDGTKFLADDGDYKEIALSGGGMEYVTINRRFSDAEIRYYGQISLSDYDKLYAAIVGKKALAVVWTENKAIYAMTMLGKKSTYVEGKSVHIECIAIQYTTGNTGGNNGYGFEPLYLTLERSNILPGSIIEGEMESEGQFMFLNSGDGSKYLADNGQYKEISGRGGESNIQFIDVESRYQSMGGVYEWYLENITFQQVEAAINANKLIIIRYSSAYIIPLGYRFVVTQISKFSDSDNNLQGYNLFTIAQKESQSVKDDSGNYTFKNDGTPLFMKVVTILSSGQVYFDGMQYSDQQILPVDLDFKTKGDGQKFLADNGKYDYVANPPVLVKITNDYPIWEDGISYSGVITMDKMEILNAEELKYRFLNNIPFLVEMVYTVNGAVFKMHRDITFESSGDIIITFRSYLTQGKSCFDVQLWLQFSKAGEFTQPPFLKTTKMADNVYRTITLEGPEITDKLKNIIVYTKTAGVDGQILEIKDGFPTWVDKSSEAKTPAIILLGAVNENSRTISQSARNQLSSFLAVDPDNHQMPYAQFFDVIFSLNRGDSLPSDYAKVSFVEEDTTEQIAVYKLLVRDERNKQMNEITVNIDEVSGAVTIGETATVTALNV